MKLSKYQMSYYVLGVIAAIIGLITKDIIGVVSSIAFMLIVNREYRAVYAVLLYVCLNFIIALMNPSLNILNAIILIIIGFIMYQNWMKANRINNRISLHNLSYQEEKYYSKLFGIFIVINIFFSIMQTSVAVTMSPYYIIWMLLDTLSWLAFYMIAQKIYNASYFSLAYFVLAIVVRLVGFGVSLQVVVLTLLLVMNILFIKENK